VDWRSDGVFRCLDVPVALRKDPFANPAGLLWPIIGCPLAPSRCSTVAYREGTPCPSLCSWLPRHARRCHRDRSWLVIQNGATACPLLAAALCVMSLVACAGNQSTRNEPPSMANFQPERPQVIVTQAAHPTPPTCEPSRVAQTVIDFFTAFNRGDQVTLGKSLGREGFQWYSVEEGPGQTPDFAGRDMALAYFVQRHRNGEGLRLRSIRVNGIEWLRTREASNGPRVPIALIEFRLLRRANDFPAGTEDRYHGKGRLNCVDRTILTWIMLSESKELQRLCPEPPGKTEESRAVLACG
jgi:hypothetical protein